MAGLHMETFRGHDPLPLPDCQDEHLDLYFDDNLFGFAALSQKSATASAALTPSIRRAGSVLPGRWGSYHPCPVSRLWRTRRAVDHAHEVRPLAEFPGSTHSFRGGLPFLRFLATALRRCPPPSTPQYSPTGLDESGTGFGKSESCQNALWARAGPRGTLPPNQRPVRVAAKTMIHLRLPSLLNIRSPEILDLIPKYIVLMAWQTRQPLDHYRRRRRLGSVRCFPSWCSPS